MKNNFFNRDIISISDFTKDEILHILDTAVICKEKKKDTILDGYLMGSCFFEPSTRTRLSFEAAMNHLGGKVIGFSDSNSISIQKGESLLDTMKMIEQYVDLIVMRHPNEGSAQIVAEAINIPVINAGDGANQHPTQTFIDLFTIRECQGSLAELSIGIMGDLKFGRTVHSLAQALANFDVHINFISPDLLKLPNQICQELKEKGVKHSFHENIQEVINKLDILYCTRVQKERFTDKKKYEEVKNLYILTENDLQDAKDNLRILHPLPRVNEIHHSVDQTKYAYFIQQAGNGLPVRQALLGLILGRL